MATFNIQGATQALRARSSASSQHMCARFVRMAMESGGLSTAGRPNWAWKYIGWLPSVGFTHIGTANTRASQESWTKSQAKPGDIAVYQKPGAGSTQPGHICMYDGTQWISDFRQNRMGVYAADVNAYIFRFTGEVSNAPIDLSGIEMGDGVGGTNPFGGGMTLADLNGETLASKCPENVTLKGMWSRYHLQAGERSPIMQEFMSPAGDAGDTAWDGSLANLMGSSALEKACELIAHEECGVSSFAAPLDPKFLTGYQLKGEKYKTYGWGQMYNWNGTALMQNLNGGVWTEQQLRDEFKKQVAGHIAAIEKTRLQFSDEQKAVLAHRRHFGLKPFNDLISRIKAMGRIPNAQEYRDMALAYCRGCANWNLYGKGWTNGVNREASYWQ